MATNQTQHEDIVTGPSILITAACVSDEMRSEFLPRFFGPHMLVGEILVYHWMDELAPAYNGAFWNFYELSNGGYYMAPALDCETIQICCSGNFYNGDMSLDAAGVVATLYALNSLVWKTRSERMNEMFDLLRDYAGDHAEGPAIFSAID